MSTLDASRHHADGNGEHRATHVTRQTTIDAVHPDPPNLDEEAP